MSSSKHEAYKALQGLLKLTSGINSHVINTKTYQDAILVANKLHKEILAESILNHPPASYVSR